MSSTSSFVPKQGQGRLASFALKVGLLSLLCRLLSQLFAQVWVYSFLSHAPRPRPPPSPTYLLSHFSFTPPFVPLSLLLGALAALFPSSFFLLVFLFSLTNKKLLCGKHFSWCVFLGSVRTAKEACSCRFVAQLSCTYIPVSGEPELRP